MEAACPAVCDLYFGASDVDGRLVPFNCQLLFAAQHRSCAQAHERAVHAASLNEKPAVLRRVVGAIEQPSHHIRTVVWSNFVFCKPSIFGSDCSIFALLSRLGFCVSVACLLDGSKTDGLATRDREIAIEPVARNKPATIEFKPYLSAYSRT